MYQKGIRTLPNIYDGNNFGKITNSFYSVSNYMFKVNDRNTRTRCEICSKLTIKTPERRHWCLSGFFIFNFEHISHLVYC